MAKKLKLMALFQEVDGRAAVTDRKSAPAAAGLFLMQLRARAGPNPLPRRRLTIAVEPWEGSLVRPRPRPVKIIHRNPDAARPGTATTLCAAAKSPAGERPSEPAVSQVNPSRSQ